MLDPQRNPRTPKRQTHINRLMKCVNILVLKKATHTNDESNTRRKKCVTKPPNDESTC